MFLIPGSTLRRFLLFGFIFTVPAALQLSAQKTEVASVSAPQSVLVMVADAQGAAIAQAVVRYECAGAQTSAHSDAQGSLRSQLAPGLCSVHVEADGFQPLDQQVTIVAQPQPQLLRLVMAVKSRQENVVVVAKGGPVVSDSDIGSRVEIPLRDLPQSLQIVPRQVLDQQQAHSMNDALRNVAGVTIPWTSGGRYESITIRGFTTMGQFKDEFRNDSGSTHAPVELSNIERVEVLKGPSSTVFGRLDPSGVVNLVTFSPQNRRAFNATLTSGSFQYNQLVLDATGPLNSSKTLLYRVTASVLDTRSFRNYVYNKRGFVAPVLLWQASPTLSVRLYTEFLMQHSVNDQGIVAVGTRPASIPISTWLGDPKLMAPDRQGKAGLRIDKMLANGWVLRSYERSSVGISTYNSRTAKSLAANNRTLTLNDFTSEQYFETHYWINEAVGHIHTGPLQHTLLAGFELDREVNPNYQKQSTGSAPKLDIYAPNYAALPVRKLALSLSNNSIGDYGGFYAQDQVQLRPNLKVTGGLRYDIAKQVTDQYYPKSTHTPQRNTAWSPRAGVVYQPVTELSLYATYSRSFQPQTGTAYDGSVFAPLTGTLLETGLRLTDARQRHTATISAYDITEDNVLTTDPGHDSFSVAVGQQRSKGIDFDSTWQLTEGWNLMAGYAYDLPQVTRDNTYTVGNFLAGAPRHTGNLWTHYTCQHGVMQGVGVGAGAFGAGKRFGDLANDYLLPGYARVDGNLSYAHALRGKTRLQINFNVENVADRRYFEGGSTRYRLAPGTPRAYMGSIRFLL